MVSKSGLIRVRARVRSKCEAALGFHQCSCKLTQRSHPDTFWYPQMYGAMHYGVEYDSEMKKV